MSDTPKGVLLVLLDDSRRVIASVSDFDTSTYGGFTLQQGQRMRAKDALAREAAHRLCNSTFAAALSTRDIQSAIDKLCRAQGWSVTDIPIGHTENP
ncbi:hypothetical protein [Roseomonas indoligenes]|uniref:Uncharacterized protein n=1 Tax=Roseomonas indoligenes TaxID=2820811 RepID=A0A940MYM8_9PROT|nr:hypothetical protein [Pararoseomonas indoligenes]MBP0492125.1 hypothetical protein [Pararoseomonas indoligenes]